MADTQLQGIPYGNAFIVQTPHLDNAVQMLQQQTAERRAFQQKETLGIDESMNKELSKVRSADMPVVMGAYNDYKRIAMQMLFDKSIANNPARFNEMQIQKNAAQGRLMGMINRSKELGDNMKELVKERGSKPNMFADDFGQKVNAYNSLPMDKLIGSDYLNLDFYRYRGNQTDWAGIDRDARGQYAARDLAKKTEKVSDFQTRVTPQEFTNSPSDYMQKTIGAMGRNGGRAERDAAHLWEAIPDSEKALVNQMYAQIPPEKWAYMSPDGKPQVLDPSDPTNESQQYAAYLAKKYALNSYAKAGTPQMVTNMEGKMDLQFDHQKAMEAIKQNDRIALKSYAHQLKTMDVEAQNTELDKLMQPILDEGKSSGLRGYKYKNGQTVNQYALPVSSSIKKVLGYIGDKGHPIYPDEVRMSEDGKLITPIFFERDDDGKLIKSPNGQSPINERLTQPLTYEELRERFKKEYFGVKGPTNKSQTTTTTTNTNSSGIQWR